MNDSNETMPLPAEPPADVTAPEPAATETAAAPVQSTAAASLELEPEVTFKGNGIDLTALAALGSAVIMGLLCFTCNMGYYCLPFLSLILGIVGLASAGYAVDKKRTRILSWIGIGTGAVIVLMVALFVVMYFGVLVVMAATGALE